MRTLEFLNLGEAARNALFIMAHIRKSKTSKNEVTYLSTWAFSKVEKHLHAISSKLVCKEVVPNIEAILSIFHFRAHHVWR